MSKIIILKLRQKINQPGVPAKHIKCAIRVLRMGLALGLPITQIEEGVDLALKHGNKTQYEIDRGQGIPTFEELWDGILRT